jgi:hypothetical protein
MHGFDHVSSSSRYIGDNLEAYIDCRSHLLFLGLGHALQQPISMLGAMCATTHVMLSCVLHLYIKHDDFHKHGHDVHGHVLHQCLQHGAILPNIHRPTSFQASPLSLPPPDPHLA